MSRGGRRRGSLVDFFMGAKLDQQDLVLLAGPFHKLEDQPHVVANAAGPRSLQLPL